MRAQVAECPAARDVLLQAPDHGELRVHDPLLQVDGPEVVNLPQFAALDHFARQPQGWHKAVVVGARVLDSGFVNRIQHALGLLGRARQRLFANDVLAGLGGGDAGLSVGVVRAAVVEELDGVILDEVAPVGAIALEAIACGGIPHRSLVASADRNERGHGRQWVYHIGDFA